MKLTLFSVIFLGLIHTLPVFALEIGNYITFFAEEGNEVMAEVTSIRKEYLDIKWRAYNAIIGAYAFDEKTITKDLIEKEIAYHRKEKVSIPRLDGDESINAFIVNLRVEKHGDVYALVYWKCENRLKSRRPIFCHKNAPISDL